MTPERIHDQKLTQVEAPRSFEEAVAHVVEMMFDALDTYGKQPTGNLLDAWILVLSERQVRFEELVPAARHFLNGKDFPKPGPFCDWIENEREKDELRGALAEMERKSREESERSHADFVARHGLENARLDQRRTVVKDILRGSIEGMAAARSLNNRIRSLPTRKVAESEPDDHQMRIAEQIDRLKKRDV